MMPARGKRRPRLYQRIILFQFISITTIMAIYGFISYRTNYAREVRLMTSATDRIARRLAANLSIPLWNLDRISAENLLLQEVQDPYLSAIIVYQPDGIWLGMLKQDNDVIVGTDVGSGKREYAGAGDPRPREKIVYTDRKGTVWDLGELALYVTDKTINAAQLSLLMQTVLQAVLLVTILSGFIIFILNLLLNVPLQQITATAQRIANGEIDLQAEVSGPREIATLATTFNGMTSRLRGSIEELDRYFTDALDLLCIADTEGSFRRLNREWETTLGYPVGELVGRRFIDFVHPDDREQTLAELSRLRGQREVLNFTNRYRHKDGSYRWIEWRSFPHDNLIYAVARDITKRKLAEDEIRRLNESLEERVALRTAELQAMNKELEAFAYSIAHDLRAPLRAINGYSHIICEKFEAASDEEGRHAFNVVFGETRRMDQMIESLLDLARIGRSSLQYATVDMTALARSAFDSVTEPRVRARCEFRLADLPATIGDPSLLRIVWVNLLSNAVKFSSRIERATIRVEGAVQGNETRYSVRDNGVGFDMRYAKNLFGFFQRLHAPSEFEGNGIGLALVRRIISLHGGRIWAEGEVEKGATFTFALPRLTASANPVSLPARDASARSPDG